MGLPIVRIGALEDAVLLDRLFSKSRHFAGFGQIQVSVQGIGIQLQLSCVLDHRLLELSLVDKDISKIVLHHRLIRTELICAIQQALCFIKSSLADPDNGECLKCGRGLSGACSAASCHNNTSSFQMAFLALVCRAKTEINRALTSRDS